MSQDPIAPVARRLVTVMESCAPRPIWCIGFGRRAAGGAWSTSTVLAERSFYGFLPEELEIVGLGTDAASYNVQISTDATGTTPFAGLRLLAIGSPGGIVPIRVPITREQLQSLLVKGESPVAVTHISVYLLVSPRMECAE